MSDEKDDRSNGGLSNLTIGLLLALFAILWFLTAIFWVYYSSYGTIEG